MRKNTKDLSERFVEMCIPVTETGCFRNDSNRYELGVFKMTTKLQPYCAHINGNNTEVCESSDVSALEAENERLRKLVEEKEQYKTVYTNLCRDLRAERARYIAILQSWKNFDVWGASTVRVPDGQQAVTDAHEELCMMRDAILNTPAAGGKEE